MTTAQEENIVDIAVSEMSASPGEKYQRFAKLDTPAYLFCKRGPSDQNAILDIRVVYDDEAPPESFEKIAGDLGRRVFLCVKRGPHNNNAVLDIKTISGDEPATPGYVKIERTLTREFRAEEQVFLCFKTPTSEGQKKTGFDVGDFVDVQDTVQKWCVGRVVEKKDDKVKIHYEGWADKWDEWMAMSKNRRLAIYRTYTKGKDTGPPANQHAILLKNKELQTFLETLTRLEQLEQKELANEKLTKEEMLFLTGINHKTVMNCLNSVVDEQEAIGKVVLFLQKNVDLAIRALNRDEEVPQPYLESLHRIFGGDNRYQVFFNKYGVLGTEKKCDGRFAVRPKPVYNNQGQPSFVSSYVIELINYFGEKGGFDAAHHRLVKSQDDFANGVFHTIKLTCKALFLTREYLNPKFAASFVPALGELVYGRMKKVSDDELKIVDKDMLVDLVRDVEALLLLVVKPQSVAEMIEKLNLDIALRLVQCKLLEKRINGMQDITEMIDRVRRREGKLPIQNQIVAKFLSSKYITKWVEDNKVVDTILGGSAHQELIKRSAIVLKFLAQNDCLLTEHLEVLWESAVDKHESIIRVVYATLADLSLDLQETQLDAVFTRIKSIPLRDYNDVTLQFVQSFTVGAIRNTRGKNNNKWYGLDIFWGVFQDDVAVGVDVKELALRLLFGLLQSRECESQRTVYIQKCVLGIKAGHSVMQAMRLCRLILDTFPAVAHGSDMAVETIVAKLEEKHQLLGTLVQELARYNDKAHAAAHARGGVAKAAKEHSSGKDSAKEDDPSFTLTLYPHAQEIDTRLEFLDYCLSRCAPLNLSKEHVDILWKTFVSNGVVASDKSRLLTWLLKAVGDDHKTLQAFNADVCKYIFATYLCNPDKLHYADLTNQGYACFEAYFLAVNHTDGFATTASRRNVVVTDFNKLTGVPSLWQIVTKSVNREVNTNARTFLISLHVRVDDSIRRAPLFKAFIDRCLNELSAAHEKVKGKPQEKAKEERRTIRQVVALLESFLVTLEQEDSDDEAATDAFYAKNKKLKIEVIVKDRNGKVIHQSIVVTLPPEAIVGTVRKELADYVDFPVKQLKLVYRKRVLWPEEYDAVSIREAKISPSNAQIVAVCMNPEDPTKRPADDDSKTELLVPKQTLSNNKQYFDLLFNLLKLGGHLGQRVWKLLSILPRNEALSKSIHALGAREKPTSPAEWDNLFDSSSILKLFYSLQIVESYMCYKDTDAEAKKQVAAVWCQQFIADGGLAQLHRVVLALDVKRAFNDILPQQCVSILLRLFCILLIGPFRMEAAKLAASFIRYPELIARVLSIMHAAVTTFPEMESKEHEHEADERERKEGVDNANSPSTQSEITRFGWMLTKEIVKEQPALLDALYNFPQLEALLAFGFLKAPHGRTRADMYTGVMELCQLFAQDKPAEVVKVPQAVFLGRLLHLLPQIDTRTSGCAEYFNIVQQLLKTTTENVFEPEELARHLSDKIKQHPVVELRAADNDIVLRGLLLITRELLQKAPELKEPLGKKYGLVKQVFHECLFAHPDPADKAASAPPPKCKSPESRKFAFSLLGELVRGSEANFRELISWLMPNHMTTHSGGRNRKDWEFEARAEEKSEFGYAGIKNLGCICYMNSLMQQMFMIPKLRQNILAVEEKEDQRQDSFLFAMQNIMAFLQESEKQYANPSRFCHNFKDWEGNPTNVNVQMDSNEFLNMLFDRVDEKVKGTPYDMTLKEVLGGAFSEQFIGKGGCPHFKEKEEPFYAVAVNVKNKRNLEESLRAFVEGELLSGDNAYMCGECKKKVDTLKRTCLKRLPPTLAFCFKRFEFDFDTMQKIKLNSRMEFPTELNLKAFTREHLMQQDRQKNPNAPVAAASTADSKQAENPAEITFQDDSYYQYRLAGILIHTGSADRGHYYSFAKERLTPDEKKAGRTAKWFEFNDTIVRPFNEADIPEECFGGEEQAPARLPLGYNYGQQGVQEKYRNAYLLFYDRVAKEDLAKGDEPGSPASKSLGLVRSVSAEAAAQNQARAEAHAHAAEPTKLFRNVAFKVPVPKSIFDEIWNQNVIYWKDLAVFDKAYFAFMWETLHSTAPVENRELRLPKESDTINIPVIQLATRFAFESLARSALKGDFFFWLNFITNHYRMSLPLCVWLLDVMSTTEPNQSSRLWSLDFLLDCANMDHRKGVANLICDVLSAVAPLERQALTDAAEAKTDTYVSPTTYSVRYIDSVMNLLRLAPQHWKKFDTYFQVLAHYASLGPAEAQHLARRGFVGCMIDMYLQETSPHPVAKIAVNTKGQRPHMGDQFGVPDYYWFLSLLSSLVSVSATATYPGAVGADSAPPGAPAGVKPVQLGTLEKELLLHKGFLQNILHEAFGRKRGQWVAAILNHWCWENESLTKTMIGFVSSGIEESGYDFIRPYFRVVLALTKLKDSLQEKRIGWLMSSLLTVMDHQQTYWKITDLCIEHLIRITKKCPEVYQWLRANLSKMNWLLDWLTLYPQAPKVNSQNIMLHKPNQPGWRQGDENYMLPVGLSTRKKKECLESIKEGKQLEQEDCEDSDEDLNDRVIENGEWVDVRDTVNKWCCGRVVDVKDKKVYVHYNGWSEKWNEWMDMSSPRIAKFGRFSPREEQDKVRLAMQQQQMQPAVAAAAAAADR